MVGKVKGVEKLAVGKTVLVWSQGLSRACKVQKRLDLVGGSTGLRCWYSLTLTHYDVNITLYICAEGSDGPNHILSHGIRHGRHIGEDVRSYLGQLVLCLIFLCTRREL